MSSLDSEPPHRLHMLFRHPHHNPLTPNKPRLPAPLLQETSEKEYAYSIQSN